MRTADIDTVRALLRVEIDRHTAQAERADAEAAYLAGRRHRANADGLARALQLLEQHSVFHPHRKAV